MLYFVGDFPEAFAVWISVSADRSAGIEEEVVSAGGVVRSSAGGIVEVPAGIVAEVASAGGAAVGSSAGAAEEVAC